MSSGQAPPLLRQAFLTATDEREDVLNCSSSSSLEQNTDETSMQPTMAVSTTVSLTSLLQVATDSAPSATANAVTSAASMDVSALEREKAAAAAQYYASTAAYRKRQASLPPPVATPDGDPSVSGGRTCEFCHTNKTPMWRRGPSGKGTLCNACGVRWSIRNKGDRPRRRRLSATEQQQKKKAAAAARKSKKQAAAKKQANGGDSAAPKKRAATRKRARSRRSAPVPYVGRSDTAAASVSPAIAALDSRAAVSALMLVGREQYCAQQWTEAAAALASAAVGIRDEATDDQSYVAAIDDNDDGNVNVDEQEPNAKRQRMRSARRRSLDTRAAEVAMVRADVNRLRTKIDLRELREQATLNDLYDQLVSELQAVRNDLASEFEAFRLRMQTQVRLQANQQAPALSSALVADRIQPIVSDMPNSPPYAPPLSPSAEESPFAMTAPSISMPMVDDVEQYQSSSSSSSSSLNEMAASIRNTIQGVAKRHLIH